MPSAKKTLEEEGFSIEVLKEPGCNLVGKISVSPEVVNAFHKKAIKAVNKQISLPGFRKGKAPEAMILSRYASSVNKEWKSLLMDAALRKLISLSKISPGQHNRSAKCLQFSTLSLGEEVQLTLSYEYDPEIPPIDYQDLSLPPLKKALVSEEQVEHTLKQIRLKHADWEPITDRGIQEEDFVEISIEELRENQTRPLLEKRKIAVADKEVDPYIKDAILGKKAEDTIEMETTLDNRLPTPTKIRITIFAILQPRFSCEGDALAQKEGLASKEELVEKIREHLEKEADKNYEQEILKALREILIDRYSFEIPQSLMEREYKSRLEKKIAYLKSLKVPPKTIEKEEKTLDVDMQNAIKNDLTLHFLLGSIADRENLQVSKEELSQKVTEHNLYNLILKKKEEKLSRELVLYIHDRELKRKAEEFILERLKEKQPTS